MDFLERHYFVLPRSVLEQELASVELACRRSESVQGHASVLLSTTSTTRGEKYTSDIDPFTDGKSSRKLDLNDLFIKHARSRLSEEMSESLSNTENGDVLFPHLLGKYKEVGLVPRISFLSFFF